MSIKKLNFSELKDAEPVCVQQAENRKVLNLDGANDDQTSSNIRKIREDPV